MIEPAHILQPDVTPERVRKFVDMCLKYTRYDYSGIQRRCPRWKRSALLQACTDRLALSVATDLQCDEGIKVSTVPAERAEPTLYPSRNG